MRLAGRYPAVNQIETRPFNQRTADQQTIMREHGVQCFDLPKPSASRSLTVRWRRARFTTT